MTRNNWGILKHRHLWQSISLGRISMIYTELYQKFLKLKTPYGIKGNLLFKKPLPLGLCSTPPASGLKGTWNQIGNILLSNPISCIWDQGEGVRGMQAQSLSCEHCQIIQDCEIVWGCGTPALLSDINLTQALCPKCRAQLHDWEYISVNISPATRPLQYQSANTWVF